MKKVLLCVVVIFVSLLLAANLYAQNAPAAGEETSEGGTEETAKEPNAMDKLGRGTVNLLVSPLELFQGIGEGISEYGYALGLGVGIPKGSWRTVRRAAVGIFEIITFAFPTKDGTYEPLIDEPRFFENRE